MAEEDVVRKLLVEIERDPAISQKRLAEEIGISVGMINWHVKRCVSKGLIKLQQAPVRRYLYYLTPEGFSEKANLTARYLQNSFNIFRLGREQYGALFARCEQNGWHRVALIGNSELAELAQMVASGHEDVEICALIDAPTGIQTDSPADKTSNATIDVFILTHFLTAEHRLEDSQALVASGGHDPARLLVPEFLQ